MKYNLLTIYNSDKTLIGYSIVNNPNEFIIKDEDNYIIHNIVFNSYDEYYRYAMLLKYSKAKEFINI